MLEERRPAFGLTVAANMVANPLGEGPVAPQHGMQDSLVEAGREIMTNSDSTIGSRRGPGNRRRAFGGLTLATLAGAQAVANSATAAEELELKLQFASADGTPWNDMDRRFGAQLEAITGGRA